MKTPKKKSAVKKPAVKKRVVKKAVKQLPDAKYEASAIMRGIILTRLISKRVEVYRQLRKMLKRVIKAKS